MHTCQPPIDTLKEWLDEYPTVVGNYGHLLLEQKIAISQSLTDSLRPYFESAHLDAREHFHEQVGIDLHPDADNEGYHAQYPTCLPSTAKSGLFGEVIAGLITEAYQMVGDHKWKVPIFLFRYHADVEAYLFTLARDPDRARQIWGRFGNDFIGICLNSDGSLSRLIAGEAKWRKSLKPSVIDTLLLGDWVKDTNDSKKKVRSGKGVWHELNKGLPIPHGLRQLQSLLKERDPDGHAAAILSMDKALVLTNPISIPRTDLLLIVGNAAKSRKPREVLIDWESTPPEYTAGNDLQVVEVILEGGSELIDSLYLSLWSGENSNAPI